MSLQSQSIAPVPPQTRQVVQAAFPQGNRYMQLGDTLSTLYDDTLFAESYKNLLTPVTTFFDFRITVNSVVS